MVLLYNVDEHENEAKGQEDILGLLLQERSRRARPTAQKVETRLPKAWRMNCDRIMGNNCLLAKSCFLS